MAGAPSATGASLRKAGSGNEQAWLAPPTPAEETPPPSSLVLIPLNLSALASIQPALAAVNSSFSANQCYTSKAQKQERGAESAGNNCAKSKSGEQQGHSHRCSAIAASPRRPPPPPLLRLPLLAPHRCTCNTGALLQRQMKADPGRTCMHPLKRHTSRQSQGPGDGDACLLQAGVGQARGKAAQQPEGWRRSASYSFSPPGQGRQGRFPAAAGAWFGSALPPPSCRGSPTERNTVLPPRSFSPALPGLVMDLLSVYEGQLHLKQCGHAGLAAAGWWYGAVCAPLVGWRARSVGAGGREERSSALSTSCRPPPPSHTWPAGGERQERKAVQCGRGGSEWGSQGGGGKIINQRPLCAHV